MVTPTVDVAVALVQRDGRWLVALRRADAHLGGVWEFPGGKRRADESAAAAAIRELREECAVQAVARATLDPIRHEYADRTVILTPVLCDWVAGEGGALENDGCRWVTPAELSRLTMPAANAELIAAIRARRAARRCGAEPG